MQLLKSDYKPSFVRSTSDMTKSNVCQSWQVDKHVFKEKKCFLKCQIERGLKTLHIMLLGAIIVAKCI